MSSRPLVYDLYSGPGGVGLALDALGVEHVGVDVVDWGEEYPGEFVQADASRPPLESGPDLLWMSPPCQAYSKLSHIHHDDPKEAHPTFDDLRVREVIDELEPDHYIIENVAGCDDLQDPTRLNGYGVGYEFGLERWFETSFPCPDAIGQGTSVFDASCGIGRKPSEVAEAKGVPTDWGKTAIRSAIPEKMVRYLLHYAPNVQDVELPTACETKQTLLKA